jgi:hypothetical protein
MDTAITRRSISFDEAIGIGISSIIADAELALRGGWDKWEIYESAKKEITEWGLTADEYERAMKLLTDALGI